MFAFFCNFNDFIFIFKVSKNAKSLKMRGPNSPSIFVWQKQFIGDLIFGERDFVLKKLAGCLQS